MIRELHIEKSHQARRLSFCLLAIFAALALLAFAPAPAQAVSTGYQEMYRLYNPNSGEHFYTANAYERDSVVAAGWNYEGIGWAAPTYSDTPVYRLYNSNVDPTTGSGEHHYTMSLAERNNLISLGWKYEGIGWYSDDAQTVPLYRQYNPNAFNCNHNYTTSKVENDYLVSLGWNYEGIAWYGITYVGDLSFTASVATGAGTTAANATTATISSTSINGVPYLFLPAHANLAAVTLSFDVPNAQDVVQVSLDGGGSWHELASGGALNLSALAATGNVRTLLWRVSDTSESHELKVMISGNVRALYLTSDDPANKGRSYVEASEDHSAKATGSMLLVDANGTVVYNGALTQIKGRGNATWDLDKRPYQIKLKDKTDLLETGNTANKAKTWILLANRNDATGLQNSIAMQFALALGLSSTTEFAPVDLYYDGEYRGSYLLCEKVEINSGRVDITDLEDANTAANPNVDLDTLPTMQTTNKYGNTFQYVNGISNPADITGGYLLEQDKQYYEAERCWFEVKRGGWSAQIVVKGPENCSYEEMLYISEFVQEAIYHSSADTALRTEGKSPSDYVDLESFAKVYMVNQFAKNEGWGGSSVFFYLPSTADTANGYSHVLYAGPVWDFDTAYGLLNYNDYEVNYLSKPEYLYPFGEVWFTDCPEVKDAVTQYAAEANGLTLYLTGQTSSVSVAGYKSYDAMVSEIYASQLMNEKLWGYWTFGVCIDPYDNYAQNVDRLRIWMSTRSTWLNYYGWA